MIINPNASASAEHCLSFISSQLQGANKPGVLVEKTSAGR